MKLSQQIGLISLALVTTLGAAAVGLAVGSTVASADNGKREQEIKDLKQVTRVLAGDEAPVAQPANLVVDRIIDPPLAMKHEVRLFIDERTGCHYLVAGGLFQPTTMMARRYSDGVQVCDEH